MTSHVQTFAYHCKAHDKGIDLNRQGEKSIRYTINIKGLTKQSPRAKKKYLIWKTRFTNFITHQKAQVTKARRTAFVVDT